MNVARILAYFVAEATRSLLRSWRVTLLAISTIAMSIFIAGTFLLLSKNLERIFENWREQAKIIVYLSEDATSGDFERLSVAVDQAEWVLEVDPVSAQEARERFEATFPSVRDLLETWRDEPRPLP